MNTPNASGQLSTYNTSTITNTWYRCHITCGLQSGYTSCLQIIVNSTSTGISDLSNSFNISLYPNPSKTFFTMRVESSQQNNYSLFIRDITGSIIYQQHDIMLSESFHFVTTFSNGMYFAEIIQGDERRIMRLIMSN